jgi:ABC-2 type transport system ATP-binding protein
VAIGGIDLRKEPSRARQLVGFVPQEIALYPTLSARENLFFWGRMYHLAGKDLARRVDESLDTVGLSERARERVETFSGGMKRRVHQRARARNLRWQGQGS